MNCSKPGTSQHGNDRLSKNTQNQSYTGTSNLIMLNTEYRGYHFSNPLNYQYISTWNFSYFRSRHDPWCFHENFMKSKPSYYYWALISWNFHGNIMDHEIILNEVQLGRANISLFSISRWVEAQFFSPVVGGIEARKIFWLPEEPLAYKSPLCLLSLHLDLLKHQQTFQPTIPKRRIG